MKWFDTLANFANSPEWDPGIRRASKLTPGPVREGSRFRLVAGFLGARVPLEYELVDLSEDRIVFRGGGATVKSEDEISVTANGSGARIVYTADIGMRGPMRLAEPLLRGTFEAMGRRVRDGLAAVL